MAKTYNQFYNETNGKGFDIDGYYGAQCWDGAMYYLKWLGYGAISCNVSGYAKDIWTQRKTNGILNYCKEVSVMKPGDIAVFKEVAAWTPYSHIAMFHSDIDGTYGWFYGQNQGGAYFGPSGGACFNLTKLPYSATYDTSFRPKCFEEATTSYTVSYNANGGVGSMNKSTVKSGEAFKTTKCAFTKEGYEFVGWNEKADGSGVAWGISSKNLGTYESGNSWTWTYTKNITLYAQWKIKKYTVSYNSNKGTGTMEKSSIEFGKAFKTSKCTFTREGYKFNGWNEKADGSGIVWGITSDCHGTYESGNTWNWTYAKNITLYAQWKPNLYTIIYNANTGVGTMKAQSISYNEAMKTTKCAFTKEGYKFIGWNEKADGTGTIWGLTSDCHGTYESGNTWVWTYTKNITLYAQWEKIATVEEPKKEEKPVESVKYPNIKGYGVDISSHNGDFDITPYDFVIIRASYGTVTDEWFERNVKKCQAANKPFGVYVYDYAYDAEGAIEQADYVMNLIKDTNVPLGIWYDLEDADGFKQKNGLLNKEHISKIAKLFCDRCKEKGYYVGVYTTKIWQDSYVNTTYPLWVAHWGTNDGTVQNDFSDFAVMHQYTAYAGVDKDVIYIDIKDMASKPKVEEPAVKEETQPVEEQKPEVKEEPVEEQKPVTKEDSDLEEIEAEANNILALIGKLFSKLLHLFYKD